MKQPLIPLYILLIVFLTTCQNPVKEFQINTDVQHSNLKLYSDSTFVKVIQETEDDYQYSGTWSGDIKEGSTFKTIATKKGAQILTLTPTNKYRIMNGQAVEIK